MALKVNLKCLNLKTQNAINEIKKNSLKILLQNYENMNKDMNLKFIQCNYKTNFNVNVQFRYKTNGEETNINIYNPYYIYNSISTKINIFGNKINFNYLKTEYKDFFWNSILNLNLPV